MAEGTAENWTRVETIQTRRGSNHYLVGLVGEQNVALKETTTQHIFVTNLADRETTRVVSRSRDEFSIYRCAPLAPNGEEGLIVACGMCNGKIAIIKNFRPFEWEIKKEIVVPVTPPRDRILVTVNLEGTLLAAAYDTSTIYRYMINPDDWSIADRQTLDTGALKIHEMHAMRNGCIAFRTKCNGDNKDVCILDTSDTSGRIQTIHLHNQDVYGIAVNKVNDSILVLYRDRKLDDFAVDVLSSSGQLTAQRILSFRKKGVTYPTFLWLDSNQIAIHENAEGDIYVYSPPGLNIL